MDDALLVEALLTTLRNTLMEKLQLNVQMLDEQIEHIKSYGYHKGLQSAVYDFKLASVSKEIEVLNRQIKELEEDLKIIKSCYNEITTSFVLSRTQFKQFTDELSKPPQLDERLQKLMKTLPPWEQPQ